MFTCVRVCSSGIDIGSNDSSSVGVVGDDDGGDSV